MKAIRVHHNGPPSVLKLEDVKTPEATPGHLLIEVSATGVNFIDIYQRTGLYPVPRPYTPGSEAAGKVVGLGANVQGFAVGDMVATVGALGSYAEHCLVPADKAVKVPDGIEPRSAAAALLQGMTAHYLATSTYPLGPGKTCLVHAAAGGVGLLLVQLAKRLGAHVYGTVSTEEKARLAREAGADEVILYTRQDFEAELRKATGGRGVDVVYDSVGQSTFDKSLSVLANLGMLVLFGQSSGPVSPVSPSTLAKGSHFLTRPSLFHYVADRESLERRAADVFGWILDGSLKLRIEHSVPLAEAADAHHLLESRQTTGKVLIEPV